MHKHCRVIILSLAIFMACVLQVGPGLLAAVDESDLAWLNDPTYEIDSPQPVVVFLENDDLRRQIDRVSLVGSMSRSARIKSVSRRLRSFVPSNAAAAAVEQFLNRCSTEPVRRFWIVPAFSATLDRSRILELAAQPGVQKIVPDLGIESIEPVEIRAAESVATSSSGHVAMINVPYLSVSLESRSDRGRTSGLFFRHWGGASSSRSGRELARQPCGAVSLLVFNDSAGSDPV